MPGLAQNEPFEYWTSQYSDPTIGLFSLFFILGHILGGHVTVTDGDCRLYFYNYEHITTQQFF
jgi:hypothetical protein